MSAQNPRWQDGPGFYLTSIKRELAEEEDFLRHPPPNMRPDEVQERERIARRVEEIRREIASIEQPAQRGSAQYPEYLSSDDDNVRPPANGRQTPDLPVMTPTRHNHDIWNAPSSASLPSRKRDASRARLQDLGGQPLPKSRRTSPTPGIRDSPPGPFSDHVFDFGDTPSDIIDLTGDNPVDVAEYIEAQRREERRLAQEKRDREISQQLSSQLDGPSSSLAQQQHGNAFNRLMRDHHLAASERFNEIQHGADDDDSSRTSSPMPRIPGAFEDDLDFGSADRQLTGFHQNRHQHGPVGGFHTSTHPSAGMNFAMPMYNAHQSSMSPSAALATASASTAQAGQHPIHRPLNPNASVQYPDLRQGFYPQSHRAHINNAAALGRPIPSMTQAQHGSGLSNVINNTALFDWANRMDFAGNPLPERLNSFLDDAYHDPRVTEKELHDLLKNITPDMDVPAKDRKGSPGGLNGTLYPHQQIALTWMIKMEEGTNKGGILADDMGLGKTISTISLILSRPPTSRSKTTLIVGPVALLRQWEEEIKKKVHVSSRMSVFVYNGKKASTEELLGNDVVLTTYGTLAQEHRRMEKYCEDNKSRTGDFFSDKEFAKKCPLLNPRKAKFYRIILDEAQCIKNKNTKAAKACHALIGEYRWCLTGTPMMNGVLELFSLVHFLRIRPYNQWDNFSQTFGQLWGKRGDPTSVAMNKLRAMLKAIMLRRKKDSQLDGKPILRLPPKKEEVVYAQLSTDEWDFYKQLEVRSQVQFSKYLRAGSIGKNYTNILVLLLRLRQACCHPHLNLDVDDVATAATTEQLEQMIKSLDPKVVDRIKGTDAFECAICMDAVPSPCFFIPCGHDSCTECVARLTEDARANNLRDGVEETKVKCPHCRTPFDPRNCFNFEAFKRVHMPESLSDGGHSDESDSESDSEEETPKKEEDDEDEYGNLKNFVVHDKYDKKKPTPGEIKESPETPEKKVKKHKGKNKADEVKPSMLKALRKDAAKSRHAFQKYMTYLSKTWLPAAKVTECIALLKKIDELGEKTIVFSQWTLLLDLIEIGMRHENMEKKPERYDGTMNALERHTAATTFRDQKQVNVMLVSLRAGNAGLNLTAASRVIIMDPFWNPYIEMQAVDRAYRIGQQREVTVHRILTKETVEDRIVALQDKKREIVEAALDETESKKIGRLNTDELKFLFNTYR